jgi:hypothetical protein
MQASLPVPRSRRQREIMDIIYRRGRVRQRIFPGRWPAVS